MNDTLQADVGALLGRWPGPCGGAPPFDRASPAALEAACLAAAAEVRARRCAIAAEPAPPTFANTVLALEASDRNLRRLLPLVNLLAASRGRGDMPAVAQRLAPLASTLADEAAHDDALFARVDAVRAGPGLEPGQRRLVEVLHERMRRRGAGLAQAQRARLAQINARIAECIAGFGRNTRADESTQAVWIDDEAGLDGLSEALREQLRQAAAALGQPGRHAVRNQRALVWPLLTQSPRRELREQVWRMWTSRGDHAGANDNKPLMAEILALRGEKAALLGYPSFAHLATAERMARTPEAALALLERAWAAVLPATQRQIAQMQAIADGEGAGIALAPWDRLHYTAELRRRRFGFDDEALRPYLGLECVVAAMVDAASRLLGWRFEDCSAQLPRIDDSVQVLRVGEGGVDIGLLYIDLFEREGKGHGSYQIELRPAESFDERVLPVACIVSNLPRTVPGRSALLAWEYANVFFHEFGHALHMLGNRAAYPSLGSMQVPWDFVELPALLNERWLADRELLRSHARHHETGEPPPEALLDALFAALRFDRVFAVQLDYLGAAIADLRLHLLADGRPGPAIDAVQVEHDTLAALGMPAAWDLVMRMPHSFHVFSEAYAAGLYVYLWADVMAADVAEAFEQAPGRWYDADVARRYADTLLRSGTTQPAERAFAAFRGRAPDPDALLRRFGLESAA